MPQLSTTSRERLDTCHFWLRQLFEAVIKDVDFSVICGHRGEEAQNEAYDGGFSLVRWPDSKHNAEASLAVDVAPYPIDWTDEGRFHYLAGWVMRTAKDLRVPIRWGGHFKDLADLGHFELITIERKG